MTQLDQRIDGAIGKIQQKVESSVQQLEHRIAQVMFHLLDIFGIEFVVGKVCDGQSVELGKVLQIS